MAEKVLAGPAVLRLDEAIPQPIKWLWPGKIAIGKLSLLAGDPGLGKSLLSLDMASRVSTGAGWPDDPLTRFEPAGVVILNAEDDVNDTIRPRLDAAQADVRRITSMQGVAWRDVETGALETRTFNLAQLPALEAVVRDVPDCKLVIIDPISAFMGDVDSHVNTDVRAVLAPLAEMAARCGVAVVAVTHLRKGGDGPAVYRAMGSLAFIAAARAAWAVARDPDDPAGRRRLFLPIKNNLGPDQNGLSYMLEPAPNGAMTVIWSGEPVKTSADDALAAPRKKKPGPAADDREAAAEWLHKALAAGPRLARELQEEAREAEGISYITLRRAQKETGVTAYRPVNPGPWWWRLPMGAHAHTCASAPHHEHLEHLEHLEHVPREVQKRGFLRADSSADGADDQDAPDAQVSGDGGGGNGGNGQPGEWWNH